MCKTATGQEMLWSERCVLSSTPSYFAHSGEYDMPAVVRRDLGTGERTIRSLRLYVATDEWIIDRVGVVDRTSLDAYAADVASDGEETRDERGEDEELAFAARMARGEQRSRKMALEHAKAALRASETEEEDATMAQTKAQAQHRRVRRELGEAEAEVQVDINGRERGRKRWRAAGAQSKKMAMAPRSRSPDPWEEAAAEEANAKAAEEKAKAQAAQQVSASCVCMC
jgi:hypothetical protein